MFNDRSFFFSATNPIANVDQRDMEAMAIKVIEMPAVLKAKEQMSNRYCTVAGKEVSAEARARFDNLLDEYPYRYALCAVNSDANHPKVLGHMWLPPHEWFGMKVPGSRSGEGDGPDGNYSIIPIDCYARYELHGKRFHPGIFETSFTVLGDVGITMSMNALTLLDLKINADDTFVITIDPHPANGRSNHIQTEPEARYLVIRDQRSDWRQIPNAYRIKRLDPPSAPPLTLEQIAVRTARFMIYEVMNNYMFVRFFSALESNAIRGPFNPVALGGLASQRSAMARLKLEDDEAFVVTLSGGVPYRSITIFDYWFRTFDYIDHIGCMNNSQGAANADGSTTYVISLRDPGVYNWLDPVGYHEPVFWVRWQGKSWAAPEDMPSVKGALVKLKDLDAALPAGMKRVTTGERKLQLDERRATYQLRFLDH